MRDVLKAVACFEVAREVSKSTSSTEILDQSNQPLKKACESWGLSGDELSTSTPMIRLASFASAMCRLRGAQLESTGQLLQLQDLLNSDGTMWPQLLPILVAQNVDLDVLKVITWSSPRPLECVPPLQELIQRTRNQSTQTRATSLAAVAGGNSTAIVDNIANTLALIVTGLPVFPQPLSVSSSTWLCSPDLEALLTRHLRSLEFLLARELPSTLGREEEAISAEILAELRRSLRSTTDAASTLWQSINTVPIAFELEERQLSKKDESDNGTDIAFVVDVDIPGQLKGSWAELVQVKKPDRGGNSYGNSWNIKTKQLSEIQSYSASATYWFVDREGGVLCVPAKILSALVAGTARETQKTARVGLNQIRSSAIPLSEFLTKLLLGAWLGSQDSKVLKVARGEDPGNRPRNVAILKVLKADRG